MSQRVYGRQLQLAFLIKLNLYDFNIHFKYALQIHSIIVT